MVDLDKLPLYELQTLYYLIWKEKDEESKLSKEDQSARALGRALADGM